LEKVASQPENAKINGLLFQKFSSFQIALPPIEAEILFIFSLKIKRL